MTLFEGGAMQRVDAACMNAIARCLKNVMVDVQGGVLERWTTSG